METKCIICFILTVAGCTTAATWNNLNCPAPRAPDNGLSFIFRNGELVHFRCHPGYVMRGKPVAYCVNNVWTEPAPECIQVQKWPLVSSMGKTEEFRRRDEKFVYSDPSKLEKHRKLFNWEDGDYKVSKQSVYGDGPRRLPLINGIWPPQEQKEQVLALGPQSTPGPKTMVEEEINIAELRNKQLEELRKQRYVESTFRGKRKQGRKRNKNKRKNSVPVDDKISRETVVSVGNTEEGQAISLAFSKAKNGTNKLPTRHKHRHTGGRRRKQGGKRWKIVHPTQSNFIIARSSRVDTSGIAPYHTRYQFPSSVNKNYQELRKRPEERVDRQGSTEISLADYDNSCLESLYGREVPMIAPQVPNAFVYRYETRKNKMYPFNTYMQVKYRCFNGFSFANSKAQTLRCKEASWVGEIPRCVKITSIN